MSLVSAAGRALGQKWTPPAAAAPRGCVHLRRESVPYKTHVRNESGNNTRSRGGWEGGRICTQYVWACNMAQKGNATCCRHAPGCVCVVSPLSGSTRVTGHRTVGSLIRMTHLGPSARYLPHSSKLKGSPTPRPCVPLSRMLGRKRRQSSSGSPMASPAARTLSALTTCSVCSPGRPPTLANDAPGASTSLGRATCSADAKNSSTSRRPSAVEVSARTCSSPDALRRTLSSSPSTVHS